MATFKEKISFIKYKLYTNISKRGKFVEKKVLQNHWNKKDDSTVLRPLTMRMNAYSWPWALVHTSPSCVGYTRSSRSDSTGTGYRQAGQSTPWSPSAGWDTAPRRS